MSTTTKKSDQNTPQTKNTQSGTITKRPPIVICDRHGKVWDGPHI